MSYPIIDSNPARALEIGKAAEHLVCADLILLGYRAFLSDQGLPYDLVVDHEGHMIRVQVKATCYPTNLNSCGKTERIGYAFSARRRGKNGSKRLTNDDCDIMALVALDIRAIAYLPIHEVGQSCQLMGPTHDFVGKYKRNKIQPITQFPFDAALARI